MEAATREHYLLFYLNLLSIHKQIYGFYSIQARPIIIITLYAQSPATAATYTHINTYYYHPLYQV